MKRYTLIILSILFYYYSQSQDLLANGGFEDENICTEYKINCAPEAWLTNDDIFFNYFKQVNLAHSGSHCIAVEAGHAIKTYKRTFFRSQLLCVLNAASKYKLELFVKSPHPVLDSIGVYFTSSDFLFNRIPLENIKPSFYLVQGGNSFKDDSSWQRIVFEYTALGDEAFITIGNFSKRDITGPTGIKMENNFFVLIDDVSLISLNATERICANWQVTKQRIYDQDERHEFLRRKIKEGKFSAYDSIKAGKNTITVIDTFLVPDILFETGKSALKPESYLLLDSLCQNIIGNLVDSIIVEGHTDITGTYELNEKLSEKRAINVKKYLQDKTGYDFIKTRGKAYLKPIADNQSQEGRSKNRRVEIVIYTRE